MPDEVNIDELLELESEEDRSRKIQVGGGESCPSPSPSPCPSLKLMPCLPCLLSTYCVPSTIAIALHLLTYLIVTKSYEVGAVLRLTEI